MAIAASLSAGEARSACRTGSKACPALLRMKPGADAVSATGEVSATQPRYYFTFRARTGQQITISAQGGGLKTGAGFPIRFPDGNGDAISENIPFALPQTGRYVIEFLANLMSEGPFGRFKITMQIK
ncbi:MAG: hypothetical protein WBX25_21455 [Rhodomicrobium sp.]